MAMNRIQIGSSSSSDRVDDKLEDHPMFGSQQCPNCGHKLDRKPDWVGLPAGVKFDPTDQELIEHLESKVRSEDKSGPLIDEFIPTIEGEDGICYTHPEKLPGVTKDGLSKHFFHRPSKAYTTGTRKRRKIQMECDQLQRGETRWHKTGKTRRVMVNGRQKGCKKILVLYTNFGKHKKPEKTNWVMHQYHLGELEEEREGELVVSKIFYQTQPRQCNWSSDRGVAAVAAVGESGSGSSTSKDLVSHREELSTGYNTAMEIQHINPPDNFSYAPFRKNFGEVGIGEVQVQPKATLHTQEEHEVHELSHRHQPPQHHLVQEQHHRQAAAAAAFHISRPTSSISGIVSPAPLHQASMVLDHDPYHVSRILLQNDKYQQQQQKLVERSGAGLEEIIMACTSADNKGETSMPHSQETEWLKYSYWSPDNPDHHG